MESTQLSTWESLSPEQLFLEINLRLWLGFLNVDWGSHQWAVPPSYTFPLEISYVRKLPPVYWHHFLNNLVSTITEKWLLHWWLSSKESAYDAGLWVWSLGGEDPLEGEMATHSNILAWKIPWRDGVESTGLQRVGHA